MFPVDYKPTSPLDQPPTRPPLEKITGDLDDLMAKLDAADVPIGQHLIRYRQMIDWALHVEGQLATAASILPLIAQVPAALAKADEKHGIGRDYPDTQHYGRYATSLSQVRARESDTWADILVEELLEIATASNVETRLSEIDDLIVACLAYKRAILARR